MRKLVYIFLFSCLMFSCSEDELLLLEKSPMFENDGSPRNIARPENVLVSGELNRKIRITWPNLSDKITSAKIVISKDDFISESIVSDFISDFIFEVDEPSEYEVEIFYMGNGESTSKPAKFIVSPGDMEVNIIANELDIEPLAGKVKLTFSKYLMSNYSYIIKYEYKGENFEKVFNSSSDSTDTFIIDNLSDDLYTYQLNIIVKDLNLSYENQPVVKLIKTLPLSYIDVGRSLSVVNRFDGAYFSWNNKSEDPAKVIVKYNLNGTLVTRTKVSSLSSDTLYISGITSPVDVQYYSESLTGEKTETKNFHVIPSSIVPFNTFESKAGAGWIISASSNQENDGGGPNALIDGNNNSFWHSPWESPIPYPHYVTISLPSTHKFTKIAFVIRNHHTPNPPAEFEVQYSVNGKDFISYESFINTVGTQASSVEFKLSKPLITNYIRLLFKTSLTGHDYMNLAELNFEGYKN